jgi:DNA-directed RNA polymerase I, II, and III subunit RPABC2
LSKREIPTIPRSLDEIQIGPRWLTRFELARILGSRTLQISMGAPVLIDTSSETTDLQTIAEREVQAGILPVSVRRTLPNGMFQDIPLTWLIFGTDAIEE